MTFKQKHVILVVFWIDFYGMSFCSKLVDTTQSCFSICSRHFLTLVFILQQFRLRAASCKNKIGQHKVPPIFQAGFSSRIEWSYFIQDFAKHCTSERPFRSFRRHTEHCVAQSLLPAHFLAQNNFQLCPKDPILEIHSMQNSYHPQKCRNSNAFSKITLQTLQKWVGTHPSPLKSIKVPPRSRSDLAQ